MRPDGDTWFVAGAARTSLCHLVEGEARCEKIPLDDGVVHALGERGADLTMVGSDSVWICHTGAFTSEPLPWPGGGRPHVSAAVRDRQQRIWGVAREPGSRSEPSGGRYRLFRREP